MQQPILGDLQTQSQGDEKETPAVFLLARAKFDMLPKVLVSLQIFDDILSWLAGFIYLSEEEQKDAGIYLGD